LVYVRHRNRSRGELGRGVCLHGGDNPMRGPHHGWVLLVSGTVREAAQCAGRAGTTRCSGQSRAILGWPKLGECYAQRGKRGAGLGRCRDFLG
jgi:hypothetical protein